MSFIAAGATFTDTVGGSGNHTANSSNLFNMVASASVTSVPISELASSDQALLRSAASPAANQTSGTVWYDMSVDLARTHQGGRYDGQFDFLTALNAQAGGGATMPVGTVVRAINMLVDFPMVDFTSAANLNTILGVVAYTAMNPGSGAGLIQKYGWAPVRISCPVTAGDLLISGTATGAFSPLNPASGATFGMVCGQIFTQIAGSGVTTSTALLGL